MKVTLYAKFLDAAQAQKALGALVDRGAALEDLSAVFPEGYQVRDYDKTIAEQAVAGVSTTTRADARVGAEKGAVAGLGVGAVAVLASLLIPGFGIVTGGGALMTALASLGATVVGGAWAGSVAGYLQDQGVPTRIALDSEEAIRNGSAILAIHCPTGKLGEFEVMEVICKYDAQSYGRDDIAETIVVG